MNQHTVSSTVSFEGFGAFETFAADLKKALESQTVVALDAPRVYGVRPVAEPVVAKAAKKAEPKPHIFGVEDVVRIRRAVARREFARGLPEQAAKLFGTRFVMKIVLGEHTDNPDFDDLCKEIEAGVVELLGDKDKANKWLNATNKAINKELDAERAPVTTKPVVAKTTTPVVARPAPVAPKAPEVSLPPKHTAEGIKQLISEAELDQLDRVAQDIVGLLKGDERYTGAERNEFMAYTRDMVLGRAMALGHSLRDAESTADATLGALPRKPRAVADDFKPAKVEAVPAKTDATPKSVVNAKPLTKAQLEAYDMTKVKAFIEAQETPKAKREHKPLRMEQLGKKVAADQQHAIEKIERMAREAERIAKVKQFAEDLKAGAQPPMAPKPPKKEKGGNDKKRGKKGQHAEARA